VKNEYNLVNAEELIKNIDPPEFIIHGFMPDKALGMIHGVSGCGKTFLSIDIAYHIACDMKWHGRDIKGGDIIYLAGEGIQGLKYRLLAYKQHYGQEMDKIHILPHGCNLNKKDNFISTKSAITQVVDKGASPKIIFVDTLHRFFDGNENNAEDAKSLIDHCDMLKTSFNCTVILIHHTGLSEGASERARGSSAWKGAMDFEYNMQRNNEENIHVKCKKMKDFEEPNTMVFTSEKIIIDNVYYDNGEEVTSIVLKYDGCTLDKDVGKPKKQKKYEDAINQGIDIIRGAYPLYGEIYTDKCHIKHQNLSQYLIDEYGKSKTQAYDMLKSDTNRLLGKMIKSNLVEKISMGGEQYIKIVDLELEAELKNFKKHNVS